MNPINPDEFTELLEALSNFNFIKYTDHYVLTIDRGIGKPVILEADTIPQICDKLKIYFKGGQK